MRGGRGRGARPAKGARARARGARGGYRLATSKSARPAMRSARTRTRGRRQVLPRPGEAQERRGRRAGGGKDWVQEEKRALREAARAEDSGSTPDEPHTREPTVPGKAHDATRTNVRRPRVARRVMGDKTRLAARSDETSALAPPPSSLRPSPSHPLRCRRDHLRRGPAATRSSVAATSNPVAATSNPVAAAPRSARATSSSTSPARRARRRARPPRRRQRGHPSRSPRRVSTRRELILQLHVLHGIREVRGDDGHERLSAKSIVQTRDARGGAHRTPAGS